MNRLLVVGLVVLLTCAAHAGGNPHIRIYFDFDPPNYVHEIYPEVYTTVDAYVCLDQLGDGIESVSFRMDDPSQTYPGTMAALSWIHLFPGNLVPSWPWEAGVTAVSQWCMTDDPALVGIVRFFYLGGPCCLEILDHFDYPRWVVDCTDPGEIDYYCVLAHASISGGECLEGDCEQVPVDGVTWGTIKSLYR